MNNLELEILKLCIKNEEIFNIVSKHLKTDSSKKSYFEKNRYQAILNYLTEFKEKYKKLPNKKTVQTELDKKEADTDLKDSLFMDINSIYDEIDLDEEYVREKLIQFIKTAKTNELFLSASIEIENGNYNYLIDGLREIDEISLENKKDDYFSDINEIEYNMEAIDREMNREVIPLGYNKLDEVLNGGLKNKELYVIGGIPGIGKSIFLTNFACNIYRQNKNVIFYTLENSKEVTHSRIYSNIYNTSMSNLLLNYNNLVNSSTGNIRVAYGTPQSLSSNSIESDLNKFDITPDVIIIDYLLLMATNGNKVDKSNSYSYFKSVAEELRSLGSSFNCPIVTAAQMNREAIAETGGTKRNQSFKFIADSKGIIDTCDFFASIIQTQADRDSKIMRLEVRKNRNGMSDIEASFSIDYNTYKIKEYIYENQF